MSRALESGMDIVIQLSADLIRRVILQQFARVRQSCFEGIVPVPGFGDVPVRKLVPRIETIGFSQARDVNGSNVVSLSIGIRLLYGEANVNGEWRSLADLQEAFGELLGRDIERFTIPVRINPINSLDWLNLELVAEIPEWVPETLREAIDIMVSIPLDFLNQTRRIAGADVSLLSLAIDDPVLIKLVSDDTLTIGLGVTLHKDDFEVDDDEDSEAPGGSVGHCGLPEQTNITDDDAAKFLDRFDEVVLDGRDWAIALDGHVLDAVLRGIPSAELNRAAEPGAEGCDQAESMRFACMRLDELRDGSLRVRGSAHLYVCPDNPAPDGWWVVCFAADARLTVEPGGRLRGTYTLDRDIEVCGSDGGWTFWIDLLGVDLFDYVPDHLRQGSFDPPFSGRIGAGADELGSLRIEDIRIRPDGIIVSGNVGIEEPAFREVVAPDRLLFGSGCEGLANTNRAVIQAVGGRIRICPAAIGPLSADDQDAELSAPERFTVVGPDDLTEGGDGIRLDAGEYSDIVVQLDGEPGARYAALLHVPNTAGQTAVRLVADLRSTRLVGDNPDEIRLERTDRAPGCTEQFPRPAPVRRSLQLAHEGPGFLSICSITFDDVERGRPILDERGEPVLDESGEATYRWRAANPVHADGSLVFQASWQHATEPGETSVTVIFAPGERFVNRRYRANMRLVTNAENALTVDVRVIGHVKRGDDAFDAFVGRFDDDIFCGEVDWNRARENGGRFLDDEAFAELFGILSGSDCCPPPRGPACQCVDLLELSFRGLSYAGGIDIFDASGASVVTQRAAGSERRVVVPVVRGAEYTLGADVGSSVVPDHKSTVVARRWMLQQDGIYRSRRPLQGLAAMDRYAYALAGSSVEIVDLSKPHEPKRVAAMSIAVPGVADICVHRGFLLAGGETLERYSLSNPLQPVAAGSLRLTAPLRFFLARATALPDTVVWAWDGALSALAVGARGLQAIARADARVRATCGFVEAGRAWLFGAEGVEVFDVRSPARPSSIAYLPLARSLHHALRLHHGALLIFDDGGVAVLGTDTVPPSAPHTEWRLESEFRALLPERGSVVPFGRGVLALQPDGSGFRVLRLRPSRVNRARLNARQLSTRGSASRRAL